MSVETTSVSASEVTNVNGASADVTDSGGQNVPHETIEGTELKAGATANDTQSSEQIDAQTQEALAELSAEELDTLQKLLPRYKQKLTIDGEEYQKTFEELVADAQKANAGQKRLREAALIEKAAQKKLMEAQQTTTTVERFIKLLKDNPGQLQRESGLSPQEFREATERYLYEQLQLDQMSPEDRERYEKSKKYDENEQELNKYREREAANAQAQVVQRYREKFDNDITTALRDLDVPEGVRAEVVGKVAYHTRALIGQGVDNPDIRKVTELVVERMQADTKSYLSSLDAGVLEQTLSPQQLKALRAAQIAAVANPQDKLNKATNDDSVSRKQEPKKGISRAEWKAHRDKLLKELGA